MSVIQELEIVVPNGTFEDDGNVLGDDDNAI